MKKCFALLLLLSLLCTLCLSASAAGSVMDTLTVKLGYWGMDTVSYVALGSYHWSVDISTSGGVMSDSGVSYAAEGEGGSAAIDKQNAVTIDGDALSELETELLEEDGEGMKKLGEVYYDAATGQYYILEIEGETP